MKPLQGLIKTTMLVVFANLADIVQRRPDLIKSISPVNF
jgi:hypothetical protein